MGELKIKEKKSENEDIPKYPAKGLGCGIIYTGVNSIIVINI